MKPITFITETNCKRLDRENGNFISLMDIARWPENAEVREDPH